MKNNFLAILVILMTISFPAKAQIPNAGFEYWMNAGGIYLPDQWTVSHGTEREANAYEGNFAIKVAPAVFGGTIYPGLVFTSFPYSIRPEGLNGYFISSTDPGDSSFINIALKKNGIYIGSGIKYITSSDPAYHFIHVPVTYINGMNPDTAIIYISAGKQNNASLMTYLIADKFSFGSLSMSAKNMQQNNIPIAGNAYPNPSSDDVFIPINLKNTSDVEIVIYDIKGREMPGNRTKLDPAKANNLKINCEMLDNGLYFYKIYINGKLITGKFSIFK